MARNSKAAAEVEAKVDKALEQLDPTLADALRAQFQTLKDEIAQLTSTVGDIGRTGVETLRTTAAGAQAAAGETLADAKARVAGTKGEVEAYARQNPAQAMGIAAGVGLLVGLLLARR